MASTLGQHAGAVTAITARLRAMALRLLLAAAVVFAPGCAGTGYLASRGWDAADVFTATVGTGAGARVRAGPLQLAAFENTDMAGLRAGQAFGNGGNLTYNREVYAPVPIVRDIRWGDPTVKATFRRTRYRRPRYKTQEEYVYSREPSTRWEGLFGREAFAHDDDSPSSLRGKAVVAHSPLPILAVGRGPAYYSQFEIAAGLGLSLRFGVNPGEFLDFVLGWLGVDVYNDDLE